MLTHGNWHNFTVSILKCKEVMKIYRDHPYGLKPYHIVLPYHFILQNNKCVIFLRNNYNFDIPAVANALSKNIEKSDRKNSYANHVINN